MRLRPFLTMAAVAVLVVAAVVQFTVPGAVAALQRDGPALAAGQWWRLVTPVFVETLGGAWVVANIAALAVIGPVAEQLGRWQWGVLLVAGTAAGQLAAYLQGEAGGGAAIAICGLAGGVLVGAARSPTPLVAPIVCYVAALAGWAVRGPVAALVAVVVAAVGYLVLALLAPRLVGGLPPAVAGGCAVALLVRGDLHGAALVGGMLAGVAVVRQDRPAWTTAPKPI